jgi:uncharacterized cupin superfamily protein
MRAAEMRRSADAHSATAAEVAAASMRNSAATEMRRSTSAAVTSASATSSRACASDVRYGACKNSRQCDNAENVGIWHATLGRPPRVLSDIRS